MNLLNWPSRDHGLPEEFQCKNDTKQSNKLATDRREIQVDSMVRRERILSLTILAGPALCLCCLFLNVFFYLKDGQSYRAIFHGKRHSRVSNCITQEVLSECLDLNGMGRLKNCKAFDTNSWYEDIQFYSGGLKKFLSWRREKKKKKYH